MASKQKITAYISDSVVYEWAKKKAEENGVTGSGYLESLIRQEMQKVETEKVPLRMVPRFSVFDTFTPKEQILMLSGGFRIHDSFAPSLGDREKDGIEQIKVGVHQEIYNDFYNVIIGKNSRSLPEQCYIVFLKTFFDGRVLKNDEESHVNYHLMYQPLLITPNLWDKYGGFYDFFNIKYLRQTDIIRSEFMRTFSSKYAGAAPIFERRKECNDSGGFFIPVYHKPVTLEQRLSLPVLSKKFENSTNLYIGVDSGNNKERFHLKGREYLKQK
ncbi:MULTISPECIES: hypothetical protein [Yersinia]|uniref:Uncharacterized protein n=1 Tax=Yersinia frederiksenii TaxID=29484 RepID=A0AAI9ENM5_YERFR|nr:MULTISPECIES: hypothetical protein [Yersinia]MDN0126345.1 hypothetical protein [Yersinia massiliensis]CFQ96233.1 Uncharacterised protein [Yersinia frederiksenii]